MAEEFVDLTAPAPLGVVSETRIHYIRPPVFRVRLGLADPKAGVMHQLVTLTVERRGDGLVTSNEVNLTMHIDDLVRLRDRISEFLADYFAAQGEIIRLAECPAPHYGGRLTGTSGDPMRA